MLAEKQEPVTLIDLTLTGLKPGIYSVSLRSSGDISLGAQSMGIIYTGSEGTRKGNLGTVAVNDQGRGELVGEISWPIWETIGRGIAVQREGAPRSIETGEEIWEEAEVVGVVARSAGVWENEKLVCGCSGKTVWQEREEMVDKGMQ